MEDLLEEIDHHIYYSIEKMSNGKWRIVGDCDIQDIMEETNLPLVICSNDDTIGGYIFQSFARFLKMAHLLM